MGRASGPYLKPDSRIFADVLSELGGRSRRDGRRQHSTDVQNGPRGQGAGGAGVYGYTPEPAATLGADALVDCFAEVPAAAFRLLGA